MHSQRLTRKLRSGQGILHIYFAIMLAYLLNFLLCVFFASVRHLGILHGYPLGHYMHRLLTGYIKLLNTLYKNIILRIGF
jgi:hypothetical protein